MDLNLNNPVHDLKGFNNIADSKHIFISHLQNNLKVSNHVASYWYSFSHIMPSLLIQASNNIDVFHQRETLITIAKEERGDVDGVPHFEMFANACKEIGIFPKILELDILEELMLFAMRSDNHKTLGLCFGLEVIANENIQYLFQNLSNDLLEEKTLSASDFFKIHRMNEDTHIELNFRNYKRYCLTLEDQSCFMIGFEYALDFWKNFWSQACAVELEYNELIS